MMESKNIDDASRSVVDRLSTRNENDINLLPYNPGRHWVLTILDMKLATCYYLDSQSSSNFNMQEMVLYATQSGPNKRVKLKWINVTCCNDHLYCLVQSRGRAGGGKVHYTNDDLDEIREEWPKFFTCFI
uniref:Ubiquitin-like protease family profile domain-containing protein n=1 Tax=Lactuca sativa TaxID=4236 RepID=A0A9R1VWL9_LACSA|nr:hypothetical protein LSAT_V11C400200060 [Lactuca sativa]